MKKTNQHFDSQTIRFLVEQYFQRVHIEFVVVVVHMQSSTSMFKIFTRIRKHQSITQQAYANQWATILAAPNIAYHLIIPSIVLYGSPVD